jgi:hypothetical protein
VLVLGPTAGAQPAGARPARMTAPPGAQLQGRGHTAGIAGWWCWQRLELPSRSMPTPAPAPVWAGTAGRRPLALLVLTTH